ncbi:MAG: hypothetical protein MK207_03415 [Saprospiraceae bacterium]|nr:hypothetical protein [Saprospiraceae bacterium]
MIYLKSNFSFVVSILFFLLLSPLLQSQVVSTEFGQNRMQYEQKKWYRYETINFAFSYAEKDIQLAQYVLPVTELDYIQLSRLFEHQLKKRIEIIIHSNYGNYLQSNIGLSRHNVNQGGVTRLITPKIEVYFNGDHSNLRKQIRKGLANVLLGKILIGTNLQEMVQNSVLMNLPQWFIKGAIAYATENWNTDLDNRLRDVLLSGKYDNFVEFSKKEPLLAGHSLFHFVSKAYNKSTVSNLLYLTRINRSVENGFLYVFGKTFYQVVGSDWFNFYSNRYNSDNKKRRFPNKGELKLKTPKNARIKNIKLSPNAKFLTYVEHNEGVRKAIIYNLENNTQQVLYRQGARDISGKYEKNYPLIGWTNNSETVIIIYEKHNKVKIHYHSINKKKKKIKDKTITGIERVIDFDVNKGTSLILIGIKNGHSDIYTYNGGPARKITNDFWDEKELSIVTLKDQKGIIFSSNRPIPILNSKRFTNELPSENFDLYFYNLETKSKQLIQLTRTPFANERCPIPMGKKNLFSYLSDVNGLYNRYVAFIDTLLVRKERVLILEDGTLMNIEQGASFSHLPVDSSYIKPIYIETGIEHANTDYSRNILEQDATINKIADLIYRKGEYHIFVRDAKPERVMKNVKTTSYRKLIEKANGMKKLALSTPAIQPLSNQNKTKGEPSNLKLSNIAKNKKDSLNPEDSSKIDIDNYKFQSEYQDLKEPRSDNEEENTDETTPIVLIEDGDNLKAQKKKKPIRQSINTEPETKVVQWNYTHANKYKSIFKLDHITFQMDNTPLYNGMNMYLGNYYQFQPLGFALKTGFMDIFENFYFDLGIRLPFDFNGIEYFINVENKKGPIDQKYSFYRRGRVNNYIVEDTSTNFSIEVKGRTIKHLLQNELKYSITKFQSIRSIISLQLDKVAILAEEPISLQIPVYYENRLGFRLEYVFDNCFDLNLNAKKGTKFKGFLDLYKPFSVETQDKFRVGFEGGITAALGFDARQYLSFDNKTIFAFRLAAASSFGEQKILYSLGGVENWILPVTSTTISLPNSNDYGLQTLAANMRGFNGNARNGSSFVAANIEMRIPIMEYISRNSPRNAMLRTLQLVAFLDIGTAWHGTSPFSTENPLNTTIIDNNAPNVVSPVKVTINYYRQPILFGYGFGIRTVLLGHYFRLDYAWGVETGQVQKPVLYLAIGTDF